ncbi:MAG: DUF4304 domain-containing protein [Acidimicrobiales bacterium]
MLRSRLAPALRNRGFRGSGSNYQLPSDTHWALIGFQGRTANSPDRVLFTINLKVVAKESWRAMFQEKPYIGEKPKANIKAGGDEWSVRIGQLMPERADRWWEVLRDRPTDQPAADALAAIDAHGIPAMLERMRA